MCVCICVNELNVLKISMCVGVCVFGEIPIQGTNTMMILHTISPPPEPNSNM